MKSNAFPSTLSLSQRSYIFNLDGLRGFAALLVVFHHMLHHQFSLDPTYLSEAGWFVPLPGHSSVLLFFILSGYVIGLANPLALKRQTILPYLRKRLVRLYPIYLASLLFTLLIAKQYYSPLHVAGHFLFLQNSLVPSIWENNPLWSLSNEVFYYLLFIPISYFKLAPSKVGIGAGLIGIACATLFPMPVVSSYCLGFVFWTSGLWLAQAQHLPKRYASRWLLLALFCLFVGYEGTSPFTLLALKAASFLSIEVRYPTSIGIAITDLLQLPFCFYIILCFANYSLWKNKLFLFLLIGPCFLYYLYIISKYGFASHHALHFLLPILALTLGLSALAVAQGRQFPDKPRLLPTYLLKLGALSYGIYVIHFPVSSALADITAFSGSWLTFSSRVVLDIGLVLGLAWVLETKLQPWITTRFDRKLQAR